MRHPVLLITFSAVVVMSLFSVYMLSFSSNRLTVLQSRQQHLPKLTSKAESTASVRASTSGSPSTSTTATALTSSSIASSSITSGAIRSSSSRSSVISESSSGSAQVAPVANAGNADGTVTLFGLHGVKVMPSCDQSDGTFLPPLACESNLAGSGQLRPAPHKMTPVPEILNAHSSNAQSVPMYAGPPIELVFYIGDEGPESGWWPFGTASTFNDLIDKSVGCKVTSKTCSWRFGNQPEDVARNVKAIMFHPFHVNGGWGPSAWSKNLGGDGKPAHQKWAMFTLESNANYPIQEDQSFLSQMDVRFTYHIPSTPVPVLYSNRVWQYSFFSLQKQKRTDADAIFVSSNCGPKNRRLTLMRELSKFVRVHSYGKCDHNKDFPADHGYDSRTKLDLFGSYKFCFAFENTDQPGYASEKFYHALASGCLPVYMGAPDIDLYLPSPNAVIHANDFPDGNSLGQYLQYLLKNTTAYWEHLEWKWTQLDKGLPRIAKLRYFALQTWPCRACEYFAGLGEVKRSPEEELAMTKSTLDLMYTHKPWTHWFEYLGAMNDDEKRKRPHQDIRR